MISATFALADSDLGRLALRSMSGVLATIEDEGLRVEISAPFGEGRLDQGESVIREIDPEAVRS